jgi:hypothetical protein
MDQGTMAGVDQGAHGGRVSSTIQALATSGSVPVSQALDRMPHAGYRMSLGGFSLMVDGVQAWKLIVLKVTEETTRGPATSTFSLFLAMLLAQLVSVAGRSVQVRGNAWGVQSGRWR